MIEKPLVSVIINCYNSGRYLRETVDSLLAQTYTNWEAIFWDNCSTDATAEIINSYADPRFKYYRSEKRTLLGEARNLAMEQVQGDFLCFLDSDDVWVKDFLNIGIDTLMKDRSLIGFYSNYYDWTKSRITIKNSNRKRGSHDLKFILNNGYGIGMSACIIDITIIRDNKIYFDNSYQLIEDMDFFFKVLMIGKLAYDPTPLYYYRIHENNSSQILYDSWAYEYLNLYKNLKEKYVDTKILLESDLLYIRNKVLICELEDYVKTGQRVKALKLLVTNKHLPFMFWKRIGFVIFGKTIWNTAKKLLH